MSTTTTSEETRLIFNLQRDTATTSRTVALPGIPAVGEDRTRVLTNFKTFQDLYMSWRTPVGGGSAVAADFFQPTTWRDAIGSGGVSGVQTSLLPDNPWTTTGIELEFYTATKERFAPEDFED